MKIRSLWALLVLAALLAFTISSVAGAGPSAIGSPTMRWRATANPNVAEIRADGITNGGSAGNGAISWDIYIQTPNNVVPADITVTGGPLWVAQCPSAWITGVVSQTPVTAGKNAFSVYGVCTNTRTGPPVTGSDVLVATVTFSSNACANGGFVVDMDNGPFEDSTDMFDTDPNFVYLFPDTSLTDGGACGNPTAVQLANITAGPVAPMANALYPALAGAAALLAAAGVAFKGMRKH